MIARNSRSRKNFQDAQACVGKTRWKRQESAQRAVSAIRQQNPGAIDSTVRPYRCSACKHWHVGHGW